MESNEIVVKERTGERDLGQVLKLANIVSSHDHHPALGEHAWLDLVHGGREGYMGLEARLAKNNRLIGYAHISKLGTNYGLECVIHPEYRDESGMVAQTLIREAIDRISKTGGGHVHYWVNQPNSLSDKVAEILGMKKGRDLYQMRRNLPAHLPLPEGFKFRTFIRGQDEQMWLEVNNSAFNNHPEQGAWVLSTLLDRENQDWFDEKLFLLHEIENNLAAFCWVKPHDEPGGQVGEIYVIGVLPKFQGLGLGKKIAICALHVMEQRKFKQAMLYVDSSNQAALSLYNSLGFKIDHVDRAYVVDVPIPMK